MEKKSGNITIIAGENMGFNSNEIFFNSFSDIENLASNKIEKSGEKEGNVHGDYKDIFLENNNLIVKENLSFNFYHTWNPIQKGTNHIGSDSIVVTEIHVITVYENGKELKNSKERFVTSYFAYVDDKSVFNAFDYSTIYYHDSTSLRKILTKNNYSPKIDVVKKYADEVAKFKKEHRDGSPVQEQAVKNRKENNSSSTILTSTTILGSIISQIPNPFAKTGGKIIAGISKGLKVIITKPEHADEVAIMFKLEYEK